MIRLVAFSDSHGAADALERCVRHALIGVKPYAAVFLGDGEADFESLHPMLYQCGVHAYQVAGNNDWGSPYQKDFLIQLGNISVYACHGHQWHVRFSKDRLIYAAMERGAKAVFYGHTHVPAISTESGIVLLNPGTVRELKGNQVRYAELLIDDEGEMHPRIIDTEFCTQV